MDRRLPRRDGERIDRSRPVTFRFEGRTYNGFEGDVLSSALWANDVRLLGRSFKYHRPRGIYSLAGHDANVIVEDGQRTNLRGDALAITPGLDVRAVNTLGGLWRDRLRFTEWFSRFLPVGFYYKAFYTPRVLFPFYERQMRKVAGLGKINPSYESAPSGKDYAFCDALVVGAGPSGLSAAIAAAQQGLDVLVVEEQRRPGGSLAWQWSENASAQRQLDDLLRRATALEHLHIRCSTRAVGSYADHWIALVDDARLTKLRAKAMIVAAGCFEQPAVFGNNDTPGVMLGSAAGRLIHLYAVKPFDRAVVLASNSDGYGVALDLFNAGVDVAAVVDLRTDGESTDLAGQVIGVGIPIFNGHTVYEAVTASAGTRVRAAVVCPVDGEGNVQAESKTVIPCDGIAVSVGWAPNGGLIYQAGGRFRYAESLEQLLPGELPPGLFAAGRVNGVFHLEDRISDGLRAGASAAAYLGRGEEVKFNATAHDAAPRSHPFPIFAHKGKKNFVDLDEDLHLVDFANAHQEGYDNVELLKRYTTVGMGPSQGKLSNMNAVRILARLSGASINDTGTTTSRPFYQPVPIGHLAGRRFHPLRRTPMHDWHVRSHAEMLHAGAWLRPEFYRRDGQSRDDNILAEANNVRKNVGLIDVGTLGKLHICGPDAVRFLECIYTGRFKKQPIDRLRYGLACDETGVIIEDGVVARLADDRFYVTVTSGGAAAFYRELQRWALVFEMDVTLVNSTAQLTAMNVTGPNARDVLGELTDVDLASEAFPYLGVREGIVAGVSCLVMRVGFVGELGYEIHVPASSGLHVWTSIMKAGDRLGIRPFGTEAQRLLRLEKGHLIVGHDTDALTNPYEADVAWAIGKDKPFFVGERALKIASRKPRTRRLVGIVFPRDAQRLPEECHLIFAEGEIAGRITSVAKRSTLGHAIAMAFVRPDMAEVGTTVQIRVAGGSLVEAEVVPMPFYDPENTRQQ